MKAPLPPNEDLRLKALKDLHILDTPPDPAFDSIVRIAQALFDVPIALISFVDDERQWFKARVGIDTAETAREIAFCAHTILKNEVLIVEDTLLDVRFADNPSVLEDPSIRFYAGAPLILEESIQIGTLCIVDTKTRKFTEKQSELLADLARDVVSQIRLHSIANFSIEKSKNLKASHENSQIAELILDTMGDGVIVHDTEGTIIFANPGIEQIFKTPLDQVIGTSLRADEWQFRDEDETKINWYDHPSMMALKLNQTTNGQIVSHERDGHRIWLQVVAKPWLDEGEKSAQYLILSVSDISKTKEFEAQLRELKNRAEDANHTKSNFLANISHEIRTPLNGVLSMVSALSKTKMDDIQHEMIDIIEQSGKSLERLLTDIIDVSKSEGGQIVLENRKFDIEKISQDIIKLYSEAAKNKNLKLVLENNIIGQSVFIGDGARIKQILSNLIDNAIKFTHKGVVKLKIGDPRYLTGLYFEVFDTGIGMSPEACESVFAKFEQFDGSITRRYGGIGLGLHLSSHLVDLMDGTISATSKIDHGSVFSVHLPLKSCASCAVCPMEKPNAEKQVPTNYLKSKILVGENVEINQQVIATMLGSFNVSPVFVNDGYECLEMLANESFDAVLMNADLPNLDGINATKRIREIEFAHNKPRLPIIILLEGNAAKLKENAIHSGCDYLIPKPLSVCNLAACLQKFLNVKAPMAEIVKPIFKRN